MCLFIGVLHCKENCHGILEIRPYFDIVLKNWAITVVCSLDCVYLTVRSRRAYAIELCAIQTSGFMFSDRSV